MLSQKIKGVYRKHKVAVLAGGPSGEREVSLRSGAAVAQALKERGYNVEIMDPDAHLIETLQKQKIQVVYNALHGTWGEDGLVQSLLESAKIPYAGSGVGTSALCMDKIYTKMVLQQNGLPTPKFQFLNQNEELQFDFDPFHFPVVIKPNREGSSLGVSICKTQDEVPAAAKRAFELDQQILMEQFIAGRELTVGVLDCQGEVVPLPLVEIQPTGEFYDYKCKYTPGGSKYICPAEVSSKHAQEMQRISEKVFRLFRCRGGVRVDFRLSEATGPSILEINTSPGMTELSLLPMAAKQAGLEFGDLVEMILDTATLEGQIDW